ncbi:UNVERIFIED_CONTAM: hypothetical protein RMT77_000707 [Armadillidium vulgare]
MFVYCFYLLLLGGVVTPLSITKKQSGLHSIGGGKMISWEPRTMISSEDYPCEKEGLYSHPTNCSRFYRCVDFTRESRIFSRYLFECPEGMVFAATIQACVPGVCPEHAEKLPDSSSGAVDGTTGEGSVPVVGLPSPGSPGDSTGGSEAGSITDPTTGGEAAGMGTESPTTVPATAAGDVGTTEETVIQSESGGAAGSGSSTGTAEKEITGLPPVIDQDKSVVSPEKLPGTTKPCTTKYVQHERFCNLFHLCEDPSSLFSCYDGTAFSTERQMCRLSQFEEALCEGKEVFVPSAEIFRDAFNWKEVGVVPLDGNPVYNSNPYFFMNIGDGFGVEEGSVQPTRSEEPLKAAKPTTPFQTRFPSISSRPRPKPVTDNKERKKTSFSSLLGSITDLITGKRRLTPSRQTSPITNRKTVVPKVTRKDKVSQTEKAKFKDTSSFNYSPFLNSNSDLATFYEMLNTADPSKTSVSTSPYMQPGLTFPFAESVQSAAYSPFKNLRQTQSPFLNQGLQMGYVSSPSSVMYSPYAGMIPYTFGSPDISSIFRTQSSAPSNVFSQAQPSMPFSSSGSFFPYSPLYGSSLGLMASPYGFLYDPTRNSLIPVAIPPSYLNSMYASLLGANPYSSVLQLSDKEAEQLLASSLMSETTPTDKFDPKRKETNTKKKSKTNTPTPQKYPFYFNTQDASSMSSLVPAFEARNDDGETYQIVPLTQHEVETLAKQGLLERATKINKPFTYDDLENLQEGEVILTSFPKKK